MNSILCVDIPIQMISCTDTNGKITPMRFRFRDKNGEIIRNRVGAHISCAAQIYGSQKTFWIRYNYFAHEWRLSRLTI